MTTDLPRRDISNLIKAASGKWWRGKTDTVVEERRDVRAKTQNS